MSGRKTTRIGKRPARSKPARFARRARTTRTPRMVFLFILAALLFFLGLVFFTGNRSLFTLYMIAQKRNHLIQERDQLRAENARLRQRIQQLREDLRAIEEVAREEYNLKKPNEEVYDVRPR
ncbi:MAG: septum formation initiator family protein [Calditrichaeota bacterium]|nr:MAG: septum formation initiator family protein [Calditrichota bacterium]